MKHSVIIRVLVGMVAMMVVSCGVFEAGPPEKTRIEYSKFVDDKMDQLLDKHARLVAQVQQADSLTEIRMAWETSLEALTKKRVEVQRHIEALKAAKGQNWFALQQKSACLF